MKKIISIVGFLVIFLAGYVLGNIVPFRGFALPGKSISGKAQLEVKVQMNNGSPLGNIEVDVAEKPGPPPEGGVGLTNENGIATFNIKPGNYSIFFNQSNFPKNLQDPGVKTIIVEEEKINQKTIVLGTK